MIGTASQRCWFAREMRHSRGRVAECRCSSIPALCRVPAGGPGRSGFRQVRALLLIVERGSKCRSWFPADPLREPSEVVPELCRASEAADVLRVPLPEGVAALSFYV